METEKVNKMGIVPVKKLLLFMGIPIMISMALQAVYNIVDSAFVGTLMKSPVITDGLKTEGEAGLDALAIAFPVQMLIVAIAIGTGVGANALLSKSLGQGDREKVGYTAGNALFLGAVIYAVFLLFGLFGTEVYVSIQNSVSADATAEEIAYSNLVTDMANKYLKICCICSFGIIFFSVYEKLLQSTGKTTLSTIGQIAGAVTNIVLDPILIADWGAGMGIAGAAWATVIGQVVSCVLDMTFHYVFNKEVAKSVKYIRPRAKIIGEIYIIGLPAIIAQALMSFMTLGMNVIFDNTLGSNYRTAYGTYYKIQQFVLFLAFGLRDAITPIVSFNYGVGDKKRVQDGIKYGLIYTAVIMVVGTAVLEGAASPLAGVFGLSGETQAICVSALRVISASFLFAGLCVALQGVFQALGSGVASLVVSVCRQLIFVIPVAFGFAYLMQKTGTGGNYLVWITFIISETVTFAIAAAMAVFIYRKKVTTLGAEPDCTEENVQPAE